MTAMTAMTEERHERARQARRARLGHGRRRGDRRADGRGRIAPPRHAPRLRRQIYLDTVPPFAAAELVRLYDDARGLSSDVERDGGELTTILLFLRQGPLVRVLNQQIALDGPPILAFAETVFDTFKGVSKIAFWTIQTELGASPFPFQRRYCLDEISIDLPASPQAYLARLGKSTRHTIRYDMNRNR